MHLLEAQDQGVLVLTMLTIIGVEANIGKTTEVQVEKREVELIGMRGLLENHHVVTRRIAVETMKEKGVDMIVLGGHLVCCMFAL